MPFYFFILCNSLNHIHLYMIEINYMLLSLLHSFVFIHNFTVFFLLKKHVPEKISFLLKLGTRFFLTFIILRLLLIYKIFLFLLFCFLTIILSISYISNYFFPLYSDVSLLHCSRHILMLLLSPFLLQTKILTLMPYLNTLLLSCSSYILVYLLISSVSMGLYNSSRYILTDIFSFSFFTVIYFLILLYPFFIIL